MAGNHSLRQAILPLGITLVGPIILTGCILFVSLIQIFSGGNSGAVGNSEVLASTRSISPNVLRWQAEIEKTMNQHEVPNDLLPFILALTMQESGGNHPDIMQSSESMCNGKIGCISDPVTSIHYGVKHFKAVWDRTNNQAKSSTNSAVKNKDNIIKITLQAYNFGPGFVDYVFQNGGLYSEELAKSFSLKHSSRSSCGWRSPYCYGDYKYVEHVYRYLTIDDPALANISNNSLVTHSQVKVSGWSSEEQMVLDPTSRRGYVTRRTADMYLEVTNKGLFSTQGYRSASCFSPRSFGEHPKGRACDFVFRFNYPAEGVDLMDGNKLANYLVMNQQRLGVQYVIWYGKIWTADRANEGWRPYVSSYYHCPIPQEKLTQLLRSKQPHSLWTGCHYDHVHVSMY